MSDEMEEARRKVERISLKLKRRLEKVFGPLGLSISDKIKPGMSEKEIEVIVFRELRNRAFDREKIVRNSIRDAAELSATAANKEIARTVIDVVAANTNAIANKVASDILENGLVDGLKLSRRFYRNDRFIARAYAKEVQSALRAPRGVKSASKLAERLIAEASAEMPTPQYVKAVLKALGEDTPSLKAAADAVSRAARTQGTRVTITSELTISGATDSLANAVRAAERLRGAAQRKLVTSAVDKWITKRAQHQAITVARTETARGLNAGYIESIKDFDFVTGLRWNLSTSHPAACTCETFAGQDLYGLGPGGYPKDAYPDLPHPNCLCFPTSIKRKQRNAQQRQTSIEYMLSRSRRHQRDVMGPGRRDIFEVDPAAVMRPDGTLRTKKRAEQILLRNRSVKSAS